MDNLKTCTCCKIEKPISEFHKSKTQKYGVNSRCKSCAIESSKLWSAKNREKRLIAGRNYELKNKEAIRKRKKEKRESMTLNDRFSLLIKNAKSRKEYPVSIDAKYLQSIYEKQNGLCAYTKLPLLATGNQLNTMSLDRIDSNKDYSEGNVQLVCVAINKMKLNYTEDQFIRLCCLVAQNSKLSELPESLLARNSSLGTSESDAPSNISLCSDVERI